MDKLTILVAICFIFSLVNGSSYGYEVEENEHDKLFENVTSSTTKKPFLGCCFNLGNPFSFIKKKIVKMFGKKSHTVSTPKSTVKKHGSQNFTETTNHTTRKLTPQNGIVNGNSSSKRESSLFSLAKENTRTHVNVLRNSTNATAWNYKPKYADTITNRPPFIREYGRRSTKSKIRYIMPQTPYTFASRNRKYFTPWKSQVTDGTKSPPTFDSPPTTKSDSATNEYIQNTNAVGIEDLLSDMIYPSLIDTNYEANAPPDASQLPELKTNTPSTSVSKPSERNHSGVYQYNNRKLLNYGNTNYYHIRRGRNNSSVTVKRIVGTLNDSFISSQMFAFRKMLSQSKLYIGRTYPAPSEVPYRSSRYTTGDLTKFLEALRLSRKPDAFERHLANARTTNTQVWVKLKRNNLFRTYVTNPGVTRCPDFIAEDKEDDTSTMELYRHHKYYFGSKEGDSKESDDSIFELLKHYERYTPALNRFENPETTLKDISESGIKMESDEDVSLWCHWNGTFPDLREIVVPRKYLDDNTKEKIPFTATFYNPNVVITRYYPSTVEKFFPPAFRERMMKERSTASTTPITSLADAPLVPVEPKLPVVFPTQRVTTPKNIDPYGLLHKIMNYNKMRQTLYPNKTAALLPGEKPHRLHPLNQLPPLLKLPYPLSSDLLVYTSDPKHQYLTILGNYRMHKDNRTLECVQNPVEFQRPLNAIAPPAGSGFYRIVQKYRILKNRTLQMISGGSKPKETNSILRIISKRRRGSNTVAIEMRFYSLPSTVSKLRRQRIPHYLLR